MNLSLQKAIALHREGRVQEALPHYELALGVDADALAALFYGGVAAWSAGEFQTALQRLDRAVSLAPQPSAEVHYHRALVQAKLHSPALARVDLEAAIAINPNYAPALNNLGELLRKEGAHDRAESLFVRALAVNPQLHEARLNRGLNAEQNARLDLARTEFAECVKRDPDNASARAALIHVLLDLAAQEEALTLARASVKRLPAIAELWNALGQAQLAAGNVEAARQAYAHGLRCDGLLQPLVLNAALLEAENANIDAARAVYETARNTSTAADTAGIAFRLATLLPAIPASEQAIEAAREHFVTQLTRLRESKTHLASPLAQFGDTPFYLSYHGRSDDKTLLRELARTLRDAAPTLAYTAAHLEAPRRAGKWRVGFCSHFLFDQSVGRALHALIRALPRDRFEVHIVRVPPFFTDPLASAIDHDATVTRLPFDLIAARQRIAARELDLLVFPEIGMDGLTYYLAHSRLARVQWTTLGHPCTSGLDTIDAYLSYASLESESSAALYSETLIALSEGAIYPDYPFVPRPRARRDRASLGLPREGCVFVCPQSLFKLMPRFDATIAAILERAPQATLWLPDSRMPGQTAALKARLANSLGANAGRVHFFARRCRTEFVEFLNACDVLLDPFPVGGGITTWDALITGVPIVSLPSSLARSRFAYCALTQAGIVETIAQDDADYVDIAVTLAGDAPLRENLRQRLADAAESIYRDTRACAHFVDAVERALNSTTIS